MLDCRASKNCNKLKLGFALKEYVKERIEMMKAEDAKIELRVDGKTIPMNRFVQKIVTNIVVGILSSLRNVDNWREATVTLKKV